VRGSTLVGRPANAGPKGSIVVAIRNAGRKRLTAPRPRASRPRADRRCGSGGSATPRGPPPRASLACPGYLGEAPPQACDLRGSKENGVACAIGRECKSGVCLSFGPSGGGICMDQPAESSACNRSVGCGRLECDPFDDTSKRGREGRLVAPEDPPPAQARRGPRESPGYSRLFACTPSRDEFGSQGRGPFLELSDVRAGAHDGPRKDDRGRPRIGSARGACSVPLYIEEPFEIAFCTRQSSVV